MNAYEKSVVEIIKNLSEEKINSYMLKDKYDDDKIVLKSDRLAIPKHLFFDWFSEIQETYPELQADFLNTILEINPENDNDYFEANDNFIIVSKNIGIFLVASIIGIGVIESEQLPLLLKALMISGSSLTFNYLATFIEEINLSRKLHPNLKYITIAMYNGEYTFREIANRCGKSIDNVEFTKDWNYLIKIKLIKKSNTFKGIETWVLSENKLPKHNPKVHSNNRELILEVLSYGTYSFEELKLRTNLTKENLNVGLQKLKEEKNILSNEGYYMKK